MSRAATEARPITPADWADLAHPILARCVEPDMIRYNLSRPFVVEEYLYATDGRIAVRMPTPAAWSIPNPEKSPPAKLIFGIFGKDDWSRSPWRPEPTQFPPVERVCAVCSGARVLPETDCPWCAAQGPAPYEAGFCDECWRLEGKIPAGPCHECDGTGLLDALGRIEVVPGYWLQRRYVALLHEFEMATHLPRDLGPHGTTRFGIGDVTGILMPMTAPKEDRR